MSSFFVTPPSSHLGKRSDSESTLDSSRVSKHLQHLDFSPTQPTWEYHFSTTQNMCNMVFDKLIKIFPEQLTLEKQNILKQKLDTQDDVLFKMIITMHFIVLKNVTCFHKRRKYTPTIDLMKTIDSVLFPDVTGKDFSSLYLEKFSRFDTSSINDVIKRFSIELIEKFKSQFNPQSKKDFLSIANTEHTRKNIVFLTIGIKDTVQ